MMVQIVDDPDWQTRLFAKPLFDRLTAEFAYREEWSPDPTTTQIPPQKTWNVPFAEIIAWCKARWGAPAVAVIRESMHGNDNNPRWNPAGTWGALGTFVWFDRTDQAIEFKLRWHRPIDRRP